MTNFALARRNMIDSQLRPNRVTDARLLAAVGELPRERFLPEAMRAVAYSDEDVPLGNGRYLMEPMVLARLIQALQADPDDDRALVVASGRGYGAALLVRLAASVVAVESDPLMATAAEQTAKELGIDGIRQTVGPLEEGARPGPYDVILIEGAVQLVPQAIFDQLADGGRLTAVVAGPPGALGVAELFVKEGGAISRRALFDAGTPSLPGFAPPPRFTF